MSCIEYEEKAVRVKKVPPQKEFKEFFDFLGIEKLYYHQHEALSYFLEGYDVVLSSPTSSGKTEVYMALAFKEALKGNNTLIIYPTKALARDQFNRFVRFSIYGVKPAIYDGDTPENERKKIRMKPPKLLMTNFDMLHHILLNFRLFEQFFKNLSFVVVDELHYYSGFLGSHASNILRRLERLMHKRFGRKIRFFGSSATLSNAEEFSKLFFNRDMKVVKLEGSMRDVFYCIYTHNLPFLEAVASLLSNIEGKTLVFANSHNTVERLALLLKEKGFNARPYRAGYSPSLRKSLEEGFRAGLIDILVSTSALELGIDIGDVDNVVLAGFPPSISSSRQRAGRAGRKGQRANIYIVPRESPLDQYYVDNPDAFFHSPPESVYINPNNREVLKWHVIAMAYESTLEGFEEVVDELLKDGYLTKVGSVVLPTQKGKVMLRRLNIRSGFSSVEILFNGKIIGNREMWMAIKELHEGAVYLHYGKRYVVERLDLGEGKAYVREEDVDYYTKAISEKYVEPIESYSTRSIKGLEINYGKVKVSNDVVGFIVKERGVKLGEHMFDEPYSISYDSEAIWFDVPVFMDDYELFMYGLHALEHVLISMSPAFAGNDPSELGGLSFEGRIYIHESMPYGMGIVKILFEHFDKLLEMAHSRLSNCLCKKGCPRCIMSPDCGNDNRYLDKYSALTISSFLLKGVK